MFVSLSAAQEGIEVQSKRGQKKKKREGSAVSSLGEELEAQSKWLRRNEGCSAEHEARVKVSDRPTARGEEPR